MIGFANVWNIFITNMTILLCNAITQFPVSKEAGGSPSAFIKSQVSVRYKGST